MEGERTENGQEACIQNCSDDDESIVFIETAETNNDAELVEEQPCVQIVRKSITIPLSSELLLSDVFDKTPNEGQSGESLVENWITDLVKSSLTEMESEEASDSHYSPEADMAEETKLSPDLNSEYISSSRSATSSTKAIAEFLREDMVNEEMQDEHKKKMSPPLSREDVTVSYDRFARTTKVQEKPKITRTKSGSVDFIARNKSMVYAYCDRVTTQKRKRRPMTAIGKGITTPRTEGKEKNGKGLKISFSRETKKIKHNAGGNQEEADNGRRKIAEGSILNENQLASFRKLFGRFDQTRSGGISAEELFKAIRQLLPDETIPFEDVQNVHAELDIKHTGEIEFDEFLFAMTNPKNYLKLIQDDDRQQLEKEIKLWEDIQNNKNNEKASFVTIVPKQRESVSGKDRNGNNIFFTMVRTATKKESMREIRHFYVNKIKKLNDHVIHDWSKGQRCIGLSDQELVRRYNHIIKELKKSPFAKEKVYQESPYAKPLCWGVAELKLNSEIKRKSMREDRIPKILKQATAIAQDKKPGAGESRRDSSLIRGAESSRESRKTRIVSTRRYEPTGENLDQTRPKRVIETEQESGFRRSSRTPIRRDVYRAYSAPPIDLKSANAMTKKDVKKRVGGARSAPTRRIKISEFVVTPKVVPLPVYPMKNCPRSFDYDHVEEIRQGAADILQEYYNKLKKVSATNSKVIYKKLQVDQISPAEMQRHFKQSYLAYSGEYEPFVVSPWIPYPSPSPWVPCAPLGESRVKSARI